MIGYRSTSYVSSISRIFFCLFLVCIATSSCKRHQSATDEITSKQISFVSETALTRAMIDGNDESTNNTIAKDAVEGSTGFGVIGYLYHDSNWTQIFDNVKVYPVTPLSDPVVWDYEKPQYWMKLPYRFFGYYPHNASAEIDLNKCLESDEKDVTFAVSHSVSNTWGGYYCSSQTDFMLATPKPVSVEDNGKLVFLNFHHALSSVTFKIVKEYPSALDPIYVEGLEVQGLKNSGKATINNTGFITWGDVTGDNTYSYTGGLSAPLTVPKDDIKPMLLLPQSLNADTKVVLTIRDDYTTRVLAASLKTTGIDEWLAGKSYTYTLTIRGTILDIALEISDWKDIKIVLEI